MITTPLMENKTDLILPTGDPTKNAVDPNAVVTISIDRNADVQLNGKATALDQLDAALATLKSERPEIAVVVRSHKELAVQKLIDVLDAVKRAKITKVGVVTNPEQ